MTPLRLLTVFALGMAIGAGIIAIRESRFGSGPVIRGEPATTGHPVAIVANAVDGSATIIDLERLAPVATLDLIPDGRRPGLLRDPLQFLAQGYLESRGGRNYAQDTDLSRDGQTLFISRGYLGDVIALNLAAGRIAWRTPIRGFRADHMALSRDGARLFVSALIGSGDVTVVLDTRDGKPVENIPTGVWPHDVQVSDNGRSVYIASLGNMLDDVRERGQTPGSYTITVADTGSFAVRQSIPFDAGIRPFQVSADERWLYAQLSNRHALVRHRLPSGERTRTLELPRAEGITESDWDFEAPHHGLALAHDTGLLCVAARASDYAAIVAAETLELIATVATGDGPSWAELSVDGRLCLLPNTRSDDVSVVDLRLRREIARLPVGRGPKHISVGLIPEATYTALVERETVTRIAAPVATAGGIDPASR